MSNRLAFFFASLVAGAFLVAGCGGGGGGADTTVAPPIVTPTPTPSPAKTTTAAGRLVDDPGGAPLGGVQVGLAPWTGGATPIPQGTTAPDGSFTFTAPSGHYLLVIGSDSAADSTRATVHDNITLAGGSQTLAAPTPPPLPYATPGPVELSGNYRLATIDASRELPCFNDFNALRVSHGLPAVVLDEWLIENVRLVAIAVTNPSYTRGQIDPRNPYGYLSTGNTDGSGGNSCQDFMPRFDGSNQWASSPATLWFGGNWFLEDPNRNYSGHSTNEFSIDPRVATDPNVPTWL